VSQSKAHDSKKERNRKKRRLTRREGERVRVRRREGVIMDDRDQADVEMAIKMIRWQMQTADDSNPPWTELEDTEAVGMFDRVGWGALRISTACDGIVPKKIKIEFLAPALSSLWSRWQ
jgi:hypothetical protein